MAKKRGRGAIVGFVIAGLVAAGVAVYTMYFNGRFAYFTFGMNDEDIMKTDNIHISVCLQYRCTEYTVCRFD